MSRPIVLDDDITCDQLNRGMKLYQRRKGHRAAMDDTLLAWVALKELRSASSRLLDLGTGKGTVALMLLYMYPELQAVGIEAWPESVELARMNIDINDVNDRFTVHEGDLRDAAKWSSLGVFDLITGAPPFMRLGEGILPADAQRAAGRFEMRGGVEEYYAAARRNLTPDGRVVVLMDGHGKERNLAACKDAGFYPVRCIDFLPRPGRPATYSVCVAQNNPSGLTFESVALRHTASSEWTPDYLQVRRDLDLP